MYERFVNWSEANLGQWHFVLGYVIVLVSHNWPIMVALAASVWSAYRAYVQPSRFRVSWLLTALLFGFAYEYEKHVAVEFHTAIDFLFDDQIPGMNAFLHVVVGPVANTTLLISLLALFAQSLRLSLAARRAATPPHAEASGPSPYNRDNSRAPGA